MSESIENNQGWSKEEYLAHLKSQQPRGGASPNNDETITFAGFWVRAKALSIDWVLIVIFFAGFVVLDLYVLNGELGSFDYTETFDRQILETRNETSDNGETVRFTKYVLSQRDYQGRIAKVQVEQTVRKSGIYTSTVRYNTILELTPDWGGKYKTYFDVLKYIAIVAYFSVMWASKYQATIGGRLARLRVTDYNENRLTFLRSLWRAIAVFPSSIFLIGFIMIAFTKKKQALHDKISKTLVYLDPIKN